MRAQIHSHSKLLAVLKLQEFILPWQKRFQKFFSPQNRPFIFYVAFVVLGLTTAVGLWSGHLKPPGWLGAITLKPSNRHFLPANLPIPTGFWRMELTLLFFGWLLTQPQELRQHRWVRIGFSLLLGLLLLSGSGKPLDLTFAAASQNSFALFSFLLPAALLAGLWTPSLTWYLGAAFTILMDSRGERVEPDLRSAYAAARDGNLRQALRLLRPTLQANFHHYEALVLAAWLNRHLDQPWRARLALLRALRNPVLVEAQRARLLDMMAHSEATRHYSWEIPGLALSALAPSGSVLMAQTAAPLPLPFSPSQ